MITIAWWISLSEWLLSLKKSRYWRKTNGEEMWNLNMVLGMGVAPTFQVLTQRLITFSSSEEETFSSYEWDLLVPCFSFNWLQWQKLMSHHPRPHSNGWLLLTHYIAEPLLYLSHYHLNTFIVLSFSEYKASVVSISLEIWPTLSLLYSLIFLTWKWASFCLGCYQGRRCQILIVFQTIKAMVLQKLIIYKDLELLMSWNC